MVHKPLVSVITVTYNAVKLLPRTIESVHSQSIRDRIEYLVIDGASTDGTIDLLKNNKEKIDLFISEPDNGIYDAMNKGVRLSRGSWIFFMNAGDIFADSLALEDMRLDSEQADLVYGDCVQIYPQGFSFIDKARDVKDLPRKMICSHQSLAARRELLENFPFEVQYTICADYHFLLRCYKANKSFHRIDRIVGVVELENYSWKQINEGVIQKYRASKTVLGLPGTTLWYVVQWMNYGIKHILKKIVPVKWLKKAV